jgi:hypothetical protein
MHSCGSFAQRRRTVCCLRQHRLGEAVLDVDSLKAGRAAGWLCMQREDRVEAARRVQKRVRSWLWRRRVKRRVRAAERLCTLLRQVEQTGAFPMMVRD